MPWLIEFDPTVGEFISPVCWEELPERFGVSESSVRSYSRTPFFAVDDGYVSISSDPLRSLRNLEDVISGRTGDGRRIGLS